MLCGTVVVALRKVCRAVPMLCLWALSSLVAVSSGRAYSWVVGAAVAPDRWKPGLRCHAHVLRNVVVLAVLVVVVDVVVRAILVAVAE